MKKIIFIILFILWSMYLWNTYAGYNSVKRIYYKWMFSVFDKDWNFDVYRSWKKFISSNCEYESNWLHCDLKSYSMMDDVLYNQKIENTSSEHRWDSRIPTYVNATFDYHNWQSSFLNEIYQKNWSSKYSYAKNNVFNGRSMSDTNLLFDLNRHYLQLYYNNSIDTWNLFFNNSYSGYITTIFWYGWTWNNLWLKWKYIANIAAFKPSADKDKEKQNVLLTVWVANYDTLSLSPVPWRYSRIVWNWTWWDVELYTNQYIPQDDWSFKLTSLPWYFIAPYYSWDKVWTIILHDNDYVKWEPEDIWDNYISYKIYSVFYYNINDYINNDADEKYLIATWSIIESVLHNNAPQGLWEQIKPPIRDYSSYYYYAKWIDWFYLDKFDDNELHFYQFNVEKNLNWWFDDFKLPGNKTNSNTISLTWFNFNELNWVPKMGLKSLGYNFYNWPLYLSWIINTTNKVVWWDKVIIENWNIVHYDFLFSWAKAKTYFLLNNEWAKVFRDYGSYNMNWTIWWDIFLLIKNWVLYLYKQFWNHTFDKGNSRDWTIEQLTWVKMNISSNNDIYKFVLKLNDNNFFQDFTTSWNIIGWVPYTWWLSLANNNIYQLKYTWIWNYYFNDKKRDNTEWTFSGNIICKYNDKLYYSDDTCVINYGTAPGDVNAVLKNDNLLWNIYVNNHLIYQIPIWSWDNYNKALDTKLNWNTIWTWWLYNYFDCAGLWTMDCAKKWIWDFGKLLMKAITTPIQNINSLWKSLSNIKIWSCKKTTWDNNSLLWSVFQVNNNSFVEIIFNIVSVIIILIFIYLIWL